MMYVYEYGYEYGYMGYRTCLPMQETQETRVQSLGQEDPLEKEMAIYSIIFAWKIPMDKGAWRATVHGVTELDSD